LLSTPLHRARLRLAAATLLLFAAAAFAAGERLPTGERLVHREVSPYQTIVVADGPARRCLRFGDGAGQFNQSCRLHAQPAHLAFDYTRAMVATLLLWQPQPARVLLIGVGGGSIPLALAAVRPTATLDAVDIDAAVLRIAEHYFGLRAGPRLRLHAADGRDFVATARASGERFDAVLLDAFDADGIAPGLFSAAFLRDLQALLAPDGVFLANTFSGSRSAAQETATARAVFGRAYEVRPRGSRGNRLIVAAANEQRLPSPAALRAALPSMRAELARIGIEDDWVNRLSFDALGGGRP